MDAWFRLCVEVPSGASDAVSGIFFDLSSCGLQVEDGSEVDSVRLTAYFAECGNRDRIVADLQSRLEALKLSGGAQVGGPDGIPIDAAAVPGEDWTRSWRAHFRPVFPASRIVVCPPWDLVDAPEGGFRVVIEPKMAFGTGHHETTRTCLQALEREVKPGSRVLDVGTGSGILAIVAARLGAREVVAVDTDDQAIENARENAVLNDVGDRVQVRSGTVAPADGLFDVVVANVTSGVLGPMVPELRGRLVEGGRLILAGILTREADAFTCLVENEGLAVRERTREGEWTTIVCVPLGHREQAGPGPDAGSETGEG